MDRERLIQYFTQNYMTRKEMLSRLPLGVFPAEIWQIVDTRRRSMASPLPLRDPRGKRLWFVTTDEMIRSSEKIAEEAMEPPSTGGNAVLEEAYYTSFLEGSDMTVEEALAFTNRNGPPENIREQLLLNNRQALQFAEENALRPLNASTVCNLAGILTQGLDNGGSAYRQADDADVPAMGTEAFFVCKAADIPSMIGELCAYVNDPNIHPLLKAAAAHAWLMAIRPFPEGNERLARMVAYMLLMRAQYAFFREVPLSGLIAQDGYGYFEALASTIREWDITYMMQFYINVLGRAIDEIHERRLDAEAERAKQPLKPPDSGNVTQMQMALTEDNASDPDDDASDSAEEELARAGFETIEITEAELSYEEIHSTLEEFVERGTTVSSPIARRLLEWLETGKRTFTKRELSEGVVHDVEQVKNILCRLKDQRIVLRVGKISNKSAQYMFNLAPQESDDDKPPNMESGPSGDNGERLSYETLHFRLEQMVERNTATASPIARRLLEWLENDKRYFTVKELCSGLALSVEQTKKRIWDLREQKILRTAEVVSRRIAVYTFNLSEQTDAEERPPSPETDEPERAEMESDDPEGDDAAPMDDDPGEYVCERLSRDELHSRLKEVSELTGSYIAPLAKRLLKWLEQDKLTFTSRELCEGLLPDTKIIWTAVSRLREVGLIIKSGSSYGRTVVYTFNLREPSASCEEENTPGFVYDKPVIDLLDTLGQSQRSIRDRRISQVIRERLAEGFIDVAGYDPNKWQFDMDFCTRIGLVTRESGTRYRINRVLKPCYRSMSQHMKETARRLFENFGERAFTNQMMISALDYPESHASTMLHTLSLMGILRCLKADTKYYRFLVTPEKHPECFARAA